ncbi:Putative amino-acid ABC transporter-binding protein YhdW [Seminavis robusta]|uniref:Amino-acid ABC transporter-binding protein YhdW n=1 Tax=Seminavis robusta TaxID=568900 RepID=A0A9N8DSF5_9STRA|nr:Putative amino-acid ABC transporter-binding protein YhdW [Seminavis robusta]|eukprot:Sro254_g100220.1 Putative amino-acid ABC transporter-binding protein YhdW (846) ;mRNA; f:71340-73877
MQEGGELSEAKGDEPKEDEQVEDEEVVDSCEKKIPPTIAKIPPDDDMSSSVAAATTNTTASSVATIPAQVDEAESKIFDKVIENIQPLPAEQQEQQTRCDRPSQPGAFPVTVAAGVERPPPAPLLVEEEQVEEESGPPPLEPHHEEAETYLPVATELAASAELVVTREEIEQEMATELEDRLRKEFEERLSQEYVRVSQCAEAQTVEIDRSAAFDLGDRNSAYNSNYGNNHNNRNASSDYPNKALSDATRRKYFLASTILVLVVILVAVVVPTAVAKSSSEDVLLVSNDTSITNNQIDNDATSALTTALPVLQSVRERGFLRCKPESLEVEKGAGFTIDLCRAIAAAVFNDSSKVDFTYFTFKEHFAAIADGRLDVSASHVSLNMGRDVRETHTHVGFSYSTPYIYTGTGLAGVPNFVQCAQDAETFANDCRHLQVCVMINTVTQDIVEAHLPGSATKLVPGHGDLFRQFANGTCNVIAGDTVIIHEQHAREAGYTGEYTFADKLLSHEHLALLTRQDNPEWAEFCDWIVRALVAAEALNVTDQTAAGFWDTDLFGPEYTQMFAQAIAAAGNYGQMYERHYHGMLPRSRYNSINTGNTGLIVSDPLGTLQLDEESLSEEELPGPVPGRTMEAVVTRGHLYCGVILEDEDGTPRSGLAEYNSTSGEWSGLDVDFCRGLAAAVSAGKGIGTIFVNLSDPKTRYKALANNTVDVLAGDRFTMTIDVREPTTGQGFTFTTPYYYESKGTSPCAHELVTRQNDTQWADLAQWTIHATFFAEEMGITQATAGQMPVVELFGIEYRQMFRDIIGQTGNYGEIFERNLGVLRKERNQLNVEDTPQFFPILDPF